MSNSGSNDSHILSQTPHLSSSEFSGPGSDVMHSYEQMPPPPTPTMGLEMVDGFDELMAMGTETLNHAWLGMQDFGQDDWMLHF